MAPHPPDPRVVQTRPGAGRGVRTHPRLERRLGLYAASRRQEPEPRKAPGSGSGDPPGTARCWRGDPDGGGTGAEPGCAVQPVGSAPAVRSRGCRGARRPGEGKGSPQGCPPPPLRPAQTPQQRRKGRAALKEGDPEVGGVGGSLSRPAPAPSAEPRLRAPASCCLPSPRRPEPPWEPRLAPGAPGVGPRPHPGRRPRGKRGCGSPRDHSPRAWAPRPAAPLGGRVPWPLGVLGPAPLPL